MAEGREADGGGAVTEREQTWTALHTMKLSPQNSFVETHS